MIFWKSLMQVIERGGGLWDPLGAHRIPGTPAFYALYARMNGIYFFRLCRSYSGPKSTQTKNGDPSNEFLTFFNLFENMHH